jgi:ribonuclease-3
MQNLIEQPLNQNWKALLQDHTQRSWHITPRYELLSEEGPEHEKIFTVGVFLEDRQVSEGQGRTKKEAEKKASEIAYKELIGENGN